MKRKPKAIAAGPLDNMPEDDDDEDELGVQQEFDQAREAQPVRKRRTKRNPKGNPNDQASQAGRSTQGDSAAH